MNAYQMIFKLHTGIDWESNLYVSVTLVLPLNYQCVNDSDLYIIKKLLINKL